MGDWSSGSFVANSTTASSNLTVSETDTLASLRDKINALNYGVTASIIGEELTLSLKNLKAEKKDILLCGGGRKNKVLIKKIKQNISSGYNLKLIDEYKIDGDFVESQAFAFLAVRSILKLPISFPSTTGCKTPCIGGDLIKN